MTTQIKRKVLHREDFGLCVLWPKTAWRKAPLPGGSVVADVDGSRRRLRVVSEECTCRGPDRPHEHRYLTLSASTGLQSGDVCVIGV